METKILKKRLGMALALELLLANALFGQARQKAIVALKEGRKL